MIPLTDTRLHDSAAKFIAAHSPYPLYAARNAWLHGKYADCYVRICNRLLQPGTVSRTFDIANISIQPRFQRRGVFRNFLRFIERAYAGPIYIENVLDPDFADKLQSLGYKVHLFDTATRMTCLVKQDNGENE